MELQLRSGDIVLFDDEDAELVLQYKWYVNHAHHTRYARTDIQVAGKRITIPMHRLITGAGAGQEVDHIDGNGLHNWRNNLRVCSHAQNGRNRGVCKSKKSSQYKGVYPHGKTWMAYISSEGGNVYLGSYSSELEAAHAYNVAAVEKHGPYAFLNELPHDYDQSKLPKSTVDSKLLRGITQDKRSGKWYARITLKGHTYCGGYYENILDAARTYNDLATLHLGDQAKLNVER